MAKHPRRGKVSHRPILKLGAHCREKADHGQFASGGGFDPLYPRK